jgi:hypothetical protein
VEGFIRSACSCASVCTNIPCHCLAKVCSFQRLSHAGACAGLTFARPRYCQACAIVCLCAALYLLKVSFSRVDLSEGLLGHSCLGLCSNKVRV